MLTLGFALRSRNVKSVLELLLAVLPGFVVRAASAAEASSCPSRDAVEAAVRDLLSRSGAAVTAPETKFRVEDEGDRYTVTALDRTRSYVDEARDCDKRADVAAVFIALTLAPPDIQTPEPQPEPRRQAEPRNSSEQTSSVRNRSVAPGPFGADLGARAVVAPRSGGTEASVGGELALSYAINDWGFKALTGYERSLGWELDHVALIEQRIPFALLLRKTWVGASVGSSIELGPLVHLLRLRQAVATEHATFLELGGRLDARFQLSGRLAPYAALTLDFSPFGRDILLEPRGTVGKTSVLRFGVSLGMAANFP